jgi:hypothetical protein
MFDRVDGRWSGSGQYLVSWFILCSVGFRPYVCSGDGEDGSNSFTGIGGNLSTVANCGDLVRMAVGGLVLLGSCERAWVLNWFSYVCRRYLHILFFGFLVLFFLCFLPFYLFVAGR